MSATLIGTTGTWGIASAQTGLILETIDFEFKNSEKYVKNLSGEDQGGVFYNEMCDISLAGLATSTSPFSGKLAAALVLGNAIPDHMQGSNTAGKTIIKSGLKKSMNIEDFIKFNVPATYFPLWTT